MKKIIPMFLFVVALCAALSACSSVNELGLREANDGDMISFDLWGNTGNISTVEVNKITLTGEDGSEFVCSVRSGDVQEEGQFLLDTHTGGTTVTVPSGSTIYWSCRNYDEGGMSVARGEQIWLEFINQKNSHIVGYAVVRVDKIAEYHYEPTIVRAVTFPQVDGAYQSVTMEQVARLIGSAVEE